MTDTAHTSAARTEGASEESERLALEARSTEPRVLLLALSTLFKVRGGIPRFNQMLCLALDQIAPKLDLEVKVLTIYDSLEDYRKSGSPWTHLQFIPCRNYRTIAFRTLRECLSRRVDMLLIGLIGMTPLGLMTMPFLTHGFGFVAHGEEVWERVRPRRLLPARRARYAFSVSKYTADALCQLNGFDPRRVRVLPNTLAPGFEKMTVRSEEAATPLEVLSVSRLWLEDKRKGIDVTLRVLSRLIRRFPMLCYRIVGKGEDKSRLVALASSLGLKGHVIFEEDLEDSQLSERYGRCAVFVLPSGQEGFGIVFLEAMRFGKPCIGGSPGGAPEVIEDGTTGFIVPFGDERALEVALEKLLTDADLRARMGRAGRERLDARYLFPHFRDRVETLLREWLSEE